MTEGPQIISFTPRVTIGSGKRINTGENMIIPGELQQLITLIKKASDTNSALNLIDGLKMNELKQIDNITYEYKGFKIQFSLSTHIDDYADKLLQVNEIGVTCAPVLIEKFSVGDSESALISYYPDCDKEFPKFYSDVSQSVTLKSKGDFLKQVEALVLSGYKNSWASEDYGSWLVTNNGQIILDGWESLDKITHEDSFQYLDKIKKLLGFVQS